MALSISFTSYRPMLGSIPTPNELLRKKAVLNITNFVDNSCILYAILAHIHPVGRNNLTELPQKYSKFMTELNFKGFEFSLKISDVPNLEKMNPEISMNVLFYQNRNPFPLYKSKKGRNDKKQDKSL